MRRKSELLIDNLVYNALRDAGITQGMSHLNKTEARKELEKYIGSLEMQVERLERESRQMFLDAY